VEATKLTCTVCDMVFNSRNKLFAHIRDEGHDGKRVDVAAQEGGGGKRKAEEASPAAAGSAEEPPAKAAKAE